MPSSSGGGFWRWRQQVPRTPSLRAPLQTGFPSHVAVASAVGSSKKTALPRADSTWFFAKVGNGRARITALRAKAVAKPRRKKKAVTTEVAELGPNGAQLEDHAAAITELEGTSARWRNVLRIVQELRSQASQPNAATISAAISTLGVDDKWRVALGLSESLRDSGLEPDIVALAAALSPSPSDRKPPGRWKRALELLMRGETQALSQAAVESAAPKKSKLRTMVPALKPKTWTAPVLDLGLDSPRPMVPDIRMLRPEFQPKNTVTRKLGEVPHNAPYAKELTLLQFVLENSEPGDALGACQCVEDYGNFVLGKSNLWLKVAGGQKANILQASMRGAPLGASILEIGAYCGYSAMRMSLAVPGVRIISFEVDPVHMIVARNVVAHAGVALIVHVWTGHSKDLLPRIKRRYNFEDEEPLLSSAFMDQKGSRYEEDLAMLGRLNLLRPGGIVVADNVLKPGAPLFLWCVEQEPGYEMQVLSVGEFAMPSEDWVTVTVCKGTAPDPLPNGTKQAVGPEELHMLNYEADRMRVRARRPGRGVTFEEWSAFADDMKARLAKEGIRETGIAPENIVTRPHGGKVRRR